MNQRGIVVVGSANMDLVARVKEAPRAGETLLGRSFAMFPGGKGANQAVCCAKLGGDVRFVANMGRDIFQESLCAGMHRDGVNLDDVLYTAGTSTGIALITVERNGQNRIIVVSGSNMKLTPRDVKRTESRFAENGILLVQLEIPLETVAAAIRIGRKKGMTVILNPAPGRVLPGSILKAVDILTPNETELGMLTGMRVRTMADIQRAAQRLLAAGVGNVIVTLGARGCLWAGNSGIREFRARRVKAVDTTAAGDAFNGGLAFALSRGASLEEAIGVAGDTASFSVTREGAQTSMPAPAELKRFQVSQSKPKKGRI